MAVANHQSAVSVLHHDQMNAVVQVFGLLEREPRFEWTSRLKLGVAGISGHSQIRHQRGR